MGGIDEIDVVNALIDQFIVNLPETLHTDDLAEAFVGDGIILAETTAQRTTTEEDGPRAVCPADHRFFVIVRCCPGNHRVRAHAAESIAGFSAYRVTISRTCGANIEFHVEPPKLFNAVYPL